MTDTPVIAIFGTEIPVSSLWYILLAVIGWVLYAALMTAFAPNDRLSRKTVGLYALFSGVLGLLLGRLIFCLVRMDTLFYDEMGAPLGLAPFFSPFVGSISVVGLMLGVILAAPICSRISSHSSARILDHSSVYTLCYFAFMRFIEPLSGEGYGVPLEDSFLAFKPIASYNEWNEAWMLNVSFIEGLLVLIIIFVLLFMMKKIRRPGTLALYAALFFGISQILPEAFRWDDVLYIFIFARVTHIGLAVMLFFVMLMALLRGKKQGLSGGIVFLELLLTIVCLGLCILAIYALDKITAWPPAFVYCGWALVLVFLTFLGVHRIHKEDIR